MIVEYSEPIINGTRSGLRSYNLIQYLGVQNLCSKQQTLIWPGAKARKAFPAMHASSITLIQSHIRSYQIVILNVRTINTSVLMLDISIRGYVGSYTNVTSDELGI